MLYVCDRFNHSRRELRFLFEKTISLLLLFSLGIILSSCGGPPQFIDEGSESPAQIVLTDDSVIDFPDLINGLISTHTVQLTNLSLTVPAENLIASSTLAPPFEFTGGTYPGTNGNCAGTLAPGASCTLEFTISPVTTGNYTSPFNLNYFDGLADQSFNFNFTATSRDPLPAILSLNPAGAHDFGPMAIGGFAELVIDVSNTGEQAATGVTLSGLSLPYSINGDTCGVSIPAMSSCQITVRFEPLAAAIVNQTFQLDYNDGVAPQTLTKSFSGEGRIAGFLAIDEGLNFDYGIINTPFNSSRTLTIRNTGGGNATSINVGTIAAPYSITSNTCPGSLPPAGSCTLVVRYTPTSTAVSNTTLNIDYFDGFNNQLTAPNFTGQGYDSTPTLTLTFPASSPSNQATPTLRAGNIISGLLVRLYQTNSCTIERTNATSMGATHDFSPTMAEGTYEFHIRLEDSDGNLTPCSVAQVPYQYDNTRPAPPTNITFTLPYTSSATASPTINWLASGSGDVVDYQVGIDSGAGGGNGEGGFTSKGNVTSAVEAGLSLTECDYYFASVQSIDHVGLVSASFAVSATSFRYDSADPTPPSNLNEDGDGSTTNSATVTWNASTDACGIAYYEVAISEDTNANNILDVGEVGNAVAYTNVGNILSHRFDAIALTNGVAHYTTIRAVDTTGRVSSIAISDPWIVYDPSIELPDMIVWLDANDPATIIDNNGRDALDPAFNGTVDDWLDKSGSATDHDFRVSGGSSRPTYDGVNFSVDFDGANTGMTVPDHPEINNATVIQRNLTVAIRTSADISSRQILYEEGGSIRGMGIYIFNNRIYCGFYNTPAGDGDGVQPFTHVNTAISANSVYFVTWVFDYTNYTGPAGPDGDLTCYVNGASIGSVPTTSRLFAHSGNVGLGHIDNQFCVEDGSCPGSNAHFLGNMYEVMLFNNAPTAGDVTNVHTYLDNKWN